MLKQIFKYTILSVIFIFAICSCTKDVDFDQIDDFEIFPVLESSLVHLNEPASRFYIDGYEVAVIQDSVSIDVFNNQFAIDNLIKAELVLEMTNSINRGLDVQVDFFDAANQLRHTFSVSVEPSPNNEEIVSQHTEVFEGNSLIALKQTTKLVLTLRTRSGSPINENTPGRIGLKSKGVFYLKIDNSI
ncbi:hypothetical protein [Snuella lapsa]|uniref:Late embryogenesis abundant protein LEA-2 subgroup domain-containing protein n=1 Tax=Snuella lapsa TaxID=870481 RepID=A0ABP6XDZ9_9FLAO